MRTPSPFRPAVLAVVAVAAAGAAAAPAQAGTIAVGYERVDQPKAPFFTVATTEWSAAPGEANRLTVTFLGGGVIVARDAGAPLTAGNDCDALPDGGVVCVSSADVVDMFEGDAGDGDDEIAVRAFNGGSATVRAGEGDDRVSSDGAHLSAAGGPGRDLLVGGASGDSLYGGAGADELHGGAGDDTLSGDGSETESAPDLLDGGPGDHDLISYASSDGVVVDLRAGVGGAPGEGDRIAAVEDLEGGDGPDELRGDDGPNKIDGGYGADTIDGRGGDDYLLGDSRETDAVSLLRIDGGAGDDEIIAYGRSLLDGGSGDDYLWGQAAGPFVCGTGNDRVEPRRGAIVAADCERIVSGQFDLTALRAQGRQLTVTVRATGYPAEETCGVELQARAGGRVLARGSARIPDRQRRRLRLALPAPLPTGARLFVGSLRCDLGRGPVFDRTGGRESFGIAP